MAELPHKRQPSSELPRDPKTPRKVLPIQPLALTWDAYSGQHDRLDELLFSALKSYIEAGAITPGLVAAQSIAAYSVLSLLAAQCSDHMKPVPDLFELAFTSEQLRNELADALEKHTFRRIRCLKILRKEAEPPRESSKAIMEDKEARREAVLRAWQVPYKREYHRVLYRNINAMIRNSPYANTATIVQSSGTGKSRMVDQMAKLVFTIPFNLRMADEHEQALAYPLPDNSIRNHLHHQSFKTNLLWKAHYMMFFSHLFDAIRTCLLEEKPDARPYTDLAVWWHDYLSEDSRRETLYDSVTIAQQAFTDKQKSDGTHKEVYDCTSKSLKFLLATITASYEDKDSFPNENVKLMMYFDEAHILTELRAPEERKSLYDVLCAALEDIRMISTYPFALFLSTNSSLSAT